MAIFHTDTGSIKNLVVSGNLSVSGAASISGTLNVTQGITGSLLGTASWANNVLSSNIVGDITRIATGSVTASVSPTEFRITSASVNQFIVDNIGEVGIGIDTPTAKLHINNTTTSASLLVEDDTNPDSTPFVITQSGRVGIGTLSPLQLLHVSGSDFSVLFEASVNSRSLEFKPAQGTIESSNATLALNRLSNNNVWLAGGGGVVYVGTTENPGNTSPFKLDVSGSGRFTNGLTITGSLFVSGATQSGGNGNVLTYDTSTGQVYYTASTAIGGGSGGPESDPIFTARSASLATTGSNTFRTDQTISGSLTVTSSLNVFGGELVVNSTGVKIGNTIGDVHTLTGSLNVSGSITASLSGTASYANNADLLDGIDSTRFATTGSNTFRGTQTISGSLDVTGSAIIRGGDFRVVTGSTDYLRVFTDGNTFIGPTAVPGGFRLDVNGTTRLQGALSVSTGGASIVGATNINGATTITGSTTVSGSARITNALTASFGTFSSSFTPTASVLSVFGSGSDYPTFVVRGSQGELFSVTDSLTGSLFSVNNISGLPILEVFSDNTTRIGIWPVQALYTSTRIIANSSSLFSTVYSVQTASYDGLFADYTIRSGSNARAGQIMTIWSGSETKTTDTATTSFGNTSNFEFTSSVVSGELVLQCRTNSDSWTVKTIIRSI